MMDLKSVTTKRFFQSPLNFIRYFFPDGDTARDFVPMVPTTGVVWRSKVGRWCMPSAFSHFATRAFNTTPVQMWMTQSPGVRPMLTRTETSFKDSGGAVTATVSSKWSLFTCPLKCGIKVFYTVTFGRGNLNVSRNETPLPSRGVPYPVPFITIAGNGSNFPGKKCRLCFSPFHSGTVFSRVPLLEFHLSDGNKK